MRFVASDGAAADCAQASRVRFIFRDDSLEVVLGEAQEETENAFVGGENKWDFATFTNWEYWWPGFPVLVYFKVGVWGLQLLRHACVDTMHGPSAWHPRWVACMCDCMSD